MTVQQSEVEAGAKQRAGGWLRIDLDALKQNYTLLTRKVGRGVAVGAAVKADAYGLGVARVAPALYQAGCRRFFVATVEEGLGLRPLLPDDAAICILNGPPVASERVLAASGLTPVLNSSIRRVAGRRWVRRQVVNDPACFSSIAACRVSGSRARISTRFVPRRCRTRSTSPMS